MFYPNDYCRMYVIGRNKDDIISISNKLFEKYMKAEYFHWLDDPDELDFIEEKRQEFTEGLSKAEEVPDGVAIDSHY